MDLTPFISELTDRACAELWPRLDAKLSYRDQVAINAAVEKGVGHALMRGYSETVAEINAEWRMVFEEATGQRLEQTSHPGLRVMIEDRWRDLYGPDGNARERLSEGTVSSEQPVPSSPDDPVWVVLSTHTGSVPMAFQMMHGEALPQPGADVVVGFDEHGTACVVWWDDGTRQA
jgi:hypothetical protein